MLCSAMARASAHPKLVLTDEEKKHLDALRQSKTASFRDVLRARVLWRYHLGETVSQIARALKMTRKSVLKWIDKALQIGVIVGMKDTPHKPWEAVINRRCQVMGGEFGLQQAQGIRLRGGVMDAICTGSTCALACGPSGLSSLGQGRQGDRAAHSGRANPATAQSQVLHGAS